MTEATYTKNYRVYGKKIEGKTYKRTLQVLVIFAFYKSYFSTKVRVFKTSLDFISS